jgi:hypothetical protein
MAIDLAGPVSPLQRAIVLASCVVAIAAITLAE